MSSIIWAPHLVLDLVFDRPGVAPKVLDLLLSKNIPLTPNPSPPCDSQTVRVRDLKFSLIAPLPSIPVIFVCVCKVRS